MLVMEGAYAPTMASIFYYRGSYMHAICAFKIYTKDCT